MLLGAGVVWLWCHLGLLVQINVVTEEQVRPDFGVVGL
ncbi:hypothetical protein GGE09_000631 [Roseobacter sp. N2S]|nr:hypothetical protein [Roseobacter sp. N2S]